MLPVDINMEIEARTAELMAGPYNPFDPSNLIEAFQEAGDRQDEICRHISAGEYTQAGEMLARVAREYWQFWARQKAEREARLSMSGFTAEGW